MGHPTDPILRWLVHRAIPELLWYLTPPTLPVGRGLPVETAAERLWGAAQATGWCQPLDQVHQWVDEAAYIVWQGHPILTGFARPTGEHDAYALHFLHTVGVTRGVTLIQRDLTLTPPQVGTATTSLTLLREVLVVLQTIPGFLERPDGRFPGTHTVRQALLLTARTLRATCPDRSLLPACPTTPLLTPPS